MFEAGMTYTHTITMVTVQCCNCGCVFGVPSDLNKKFQENDVWFYCPNGHKMHYSESTAEKLRKELAQERGMRLNAEREAAHVEIERKKLKTKMRNMKTRVANGICPCCNCYFENLHKHMQNKHPDYKPTKENGKEQSE